MSGSRGRPTWLREECPAWCTGDHAEDDHPEDRVHRRALAELPAVLAEGDLPTRWHAAARTLVVERLRAVGRPAEWLRVQDADDARRHLVIDPASARRLAEVLVALDP